MEKTEEILTRSVAEIIPEKQGLASLMKKKKIRVYLGVDPTGTRLHLGHSIPLRKLNEFAQAGHEAILLIGTGTVLAGDPSQRSQARTKITQEEIDENIKTWRQQAQKVVDLSKVQIRQNGDWLLKLTFADIINIASHISAVQLFKREMFQRRIEAGDTVFTHETLYPLFQGYDSVALDVDLEIGGTDQTFNMLIGRELQKKMNGREKYVLATPLILGTDGKPMSKTSGNCIWLDDSPENMYGKIMSIPDSLIKEYAQNLTGLDTNQLLKEKPIDAKKKLAFEIVRTYHSKEDAQKAKEDFENVFQKRSAPQDLREIKTPITTVEDFLAANSLTSSKSEARRLVQQGGVDIDGEKVTPNSQVKSGVLKVGKKTFVKITITS